MLPLIRRYAPPSPDRVKAFALPHTLRLSRKLSRLPRKGEVLLYLPEGAKKLPLRGSWQARQGLTERVLPPKELPPFLHFMALSVKFLKICAGGFANPGGFMLYLS